MLNLRRFALPPAVAACGLLSLNYGLAQQSGEEAAAPPEEPAVMRVSPGVAVRVLRSDELKGLDGKTPRTATMLEVTLDPLAGSPPHRHPGPISGYVLEGSFEFQVEGKPKRVLKAGDTFFEPEMILHLVGRNPDAEKRTRVLATMVHPTGAKNLVIPEPAGDDHDAERDADKPVDR